MKEQDLVDDFFLKLQQKNPGIEQERALDKIWDLWWENGLELPETSTIDIPTYHPEREVSIGEMVVLARKIKGLSQQRLAERSGASKSAIQAIEQQKRRVSEEMLKKLAAGLEVRVGFLFGEDFSPAEDVIASLLKDLENPANRDVSRHIIETLIKDIKRGYVYLSLLKPESPKNTP